MTSSQEMDFRNKWFDEVGSSPPPSSPPTQSQSASELLHISPLPSRVSTSSLLASQNTLVALLNPTEASVSPLPCADTLPAWATVNGPPSVQEHSQNIPTKAEDSVFFRVQTLRKSKLRRKHTRSWRKDGSQPVSSLPMGHSGPHAKRGSWLPEPRTSNATSESDNGADDDSEEPEEPLLYDFAAVVIFHDWWVDLRQHKADEWFLMGGAKWQALDVASQDEVDSMFPMYCRYRTAYFPYQVTLRKFLVACLYVYYTHIDTGPPGQSSAASKKRTKTYDQLHPFLWDDFIRCLTVTFPPYVNQCQLHARVPMTAFEYYNTTVHKPTNRKQVVSPTSLTTFVGTGSVQPVHKIFHRTVGILQSNISLEQAMDAIRLPTIIERRKAMEAELKENEVELTELLRSQRQVRLRKEKAERQERFLEARSAGMECDSAPWNEIKRGTCN